jgi:hypothetical protein
MTEGLQLSLFTLKCILCRKEGGDLIAAFIDEMKLVRYIGIVISGENFDRSLEFDLNMLGSERYTADMCHTHGRLSKTIAFLKGIFLVGTDATTEDELDRRSELCAGTRHVTLMEL